MEPSASIVVEMNERAGEHDAKDAPRLPLDDQKRVVAFKVGDKIQRHIFRRVAFADWNRFFAQVVSEITREKNGATTTVDVDTASLDLYARAVENVDGFRTSDGRAPRELPTWPGCIHQKFQLRAIKTLMAVTLGKNESDDDMLLEADGVTVRLAAVWNAAEDGSMTSYAGLEHKFASPSAEHRRRFMRAKNRAFVAGGSRAGTTVIPTCFPLIVKLYDELIESVDGYSVAGADLATKEDIVREMDALHKSCAMGAIFQTTIPQEEASEE